MTTPAREASRSVHELAKESEHAKGILAEFSDGIIKTVEPVEILKDSFKDLRAGFTEVGTALKAGELKGVSGITEALGGIASTLDLVLPGLGQFASAAIHAFGSVAGSVVGLVQEMAKMSIEATQAKASLIETFGALEGGIADGRATEEMFSELSQKIGVTESTLVGFGQKFVAMGIESEDALRKITLAAVSAQAIMRDPAAGDAFATLAKKIQLASDTGHGLKIPLKGLGSLASMGVRVDDVAKRMGLSSHDLSEQLKKGTASAKLFGDALQDALIEKGQGPLKRMAFGMDNLKKMFGQSIEEMFEDMGHAVDPFMAQVKSLLGIFSQSTATGKVMKGAITQAFTAIFGVATRVVPVIKHFFQDMIIWSLKSYIFIRQHWTEIRPVLAMVGVTLGVIAVAFGAVAVVVGAVVGLFVALVGAGIAAQAMLVNMAMKAYEFGDQLVTGLIRGIKAGIGAVGDAASELGHSALNAIRNALEMHSPSRVMVKVGMQAGESMAGGMVGAAPKVAQAGGVIGSAAVAGVRPIGSGSYAKAGESMAGGSSRPMSIGKVEVHVHAADGVTHVTELTEVAVAALFERLALMQGV